MKTRTLGSGSHQLAVSELGLGCMGMSEFYGATDDAESIRVIEHALDAGCLFLDTADMYGPFTNERLVGRAIAGRRDEIVLATKFGNQRNPDGSRLGINGKPEYVRAACDASLERLGVDHIDLYFQHRVDTSVPIEDTVGASCASWASGSLPTARSVAASSPARSKVLTTSPRATSGGMHRAFRARTSSATLTWCSE